MLKKRKYEEKVDELVKCNKKLEKLSTNQFIIYDSGTLLYAVATMVVSLSKESILSKSNWDKYTHFVSVAFLDKNGTRLSGDINTLKNVKKFDQAKALILKNFCDCVDVNGTVVAFMCYLANNVKNFENNETVSTDVKSIRLNLIDGN
jgi:hypothetical protein